MATKTLLNRQLYKWRIVINRLTGARFRRRHSDAINWPIFWGGGDGNFDAFNKQVILTKRKYPGNFFIRRVKDRVCGPHDNPHTRFASRCPFSLNDKTGIREFWFI